MNSQDYILFWGKAQPWEGARSFHPLPWHCLDVAAAANALLDIFPLIVNVFAERGGTGPEAARRLLLCLSALHDIGKFSIGFQAKVPARCPAILQPLPSPLPTGDHPAIGFRLLTDELGALFRAFAPRIGERSWKILAGAAACHHGRPVAASDQRKSEIGRPAIAAAEGFAADIIALLGEGSYDGKLGETDARGLSWLLAGFVNLADWIGSNQAVFRYEAPDLSLADYWRGTALPRAREALDRAGLRRNPAAPAGGFAALTRSDREPSPLQRHAESVALPDGPGFFLIEDMTGAGKTEAALILAHRLMRAGRGDGIFVALPTMATANAMYGRLAAIYRRLFAGDALPSLALTHGAAGLHDGFQDSILDVGHEDAGYGGGVGGDGDLTASAACAAWIGGDRRRAFFADVGVGTIDQAFLSVLPVKFAALRQFALSRRILIVDEAHAYDAYEGKELGGLIAFHAAAGGSAIVLSATLPETTKTDLARHWRLGRKASPRHSAWQRDYPLATILDGEGAVSMEKVDPRPDLLPRIVPVERLDDAEAAIAAILAAWELGAAIAWIRNTVDDALEAVDRLKAKGVEADLFHARFAMRDRQTIEERVIGTFGFSSTEAGRRGRILVATQVVEQSLDLDFDLMVSDLAPIDLLIQRAGRLWRHRRFSRPLPAPRLLVVSPEPSGDAGADWLRRSLEGTSFVYPNQALMWRTARTLFEAGAIVSPGEVRRLVEAVYAEDALAAVPAELRRSRDRAEGVAGGDQSLAEMNLLKWQEGYTPESGAWSPEIHTPTRLGEKRTVFRLALWNGTALEPLSGPLRADMTPREAERLWALSEVAVTTRRVSGRGTYRPEIEGAASALETSWGGKDGGTVILPLLRETGDEGGFAAFGVSAGGKAVAMRYHPRTGLILAEG